MNEFQNYVEDDHQEFFSMPCGYYTVVDIKYHDETTKTRVRAGDNLHKNRNIKEWRINAEQTLAKTFNFCGGGGYYHDSTAPSTTQEHGLDDRDFEFW